MTYIIVGASAGLGRSLAEKFASEKNDLIIISSDMEDLIRLKSDLEIRFNVKIKPIEISFKKIPEEYNEIKESLKQMPPLEGILFPIGYPDSEDSPDADQSLVMDIFNINLISICTMISHLLGILQKTKSTVIGFGSVAAIRGRGKNVIYAASKRALESYFESLRFHTQDSNVIVQFYILGYLDTNLSFNDVKKAFFKAANTELLADVIYKNRFRDFGITVYPKTWKIVKVLLPLVPWNFFKNLKI